MSRILKFLLLAATIVFVVNWLAPHSDPATVYANPETIAYHESGMLVVDLVDTAGEQGLEELEALTNTDFSWTHVETADEGIAVGYVSNLAEAIQLLSTNPLVEAAEPQITLHHMGWPSGPPNDPMYDKQWHLPAMGAPAGWANTPMGKGVIVAVIDTGVTVVEDLKGVNVLKGESFTGEPQRDGNGHGTHVAGTIAQKTNNEVGVAGIAPEATILPVKVLTNSGWGQSDWVAAGIDYATDQGAHVINMSLGGSYSKIIHNAVKRAEEAGVLVIAACGNDGRPQCGYPGGLKESIGVSATGPDGELSYYSSHGKGVDIAAPGGDKQKGGVVWQNTIVSGKEDYYGFQGTSMATPHVAGAAAILLSTGKSSSEVKELLLESADGEGWDKKYGHGKLNLAAALGSTGGICWHDNSILTSAAIAFGLAIAWLAGWPSRRFTIVTAVSATVIASGLWPLGYLPLPEGLIFDVLKAPFFVWPDLLIQPGAAAFPLWLSAALPTGIAYVFGAHKFFRPLATGLLVGAGVYFLWAAVTGVALSFIPASLAMPWLIANAGACAFFAMGLAGVEKIDGGNDE